MLYAFVNHQLEPYHQANLHVSDLAIQRGYGVFDFLKMKGTQALFMDDYLDRFFRSARLMELEVPLSRESLKEKVAELASRNNMEESGIKMILTGGYSENGFDPVEPNLLIIQQPLTMPAESKISQGIRIITHEHAREMAQAKTINYTTGIRLIKQIKSQGAEEVLYHFNGEALEFPRCNFFLVKQDDTVITPARGVLEGITRKNVLALAAKKYKAEAGIVTLADIAQAKEAFLTSTTKRILPIVQVDDKIIGDGKPGPVTKALLQDLVELEAQHLNSYA